MNGFGTLGGEAAPGGDSCNRVFGPVICPYLRPPTLRVPGMSSLHMIQHTGRPACPDRKKAARRTTDLPVGDLPCSRNTFPTQRHWTTTVFVTYSTSQKLQYITRRGIVLYLIGVHWKQARAKQ